jgi:hypothetical protein
MLAKWNDYQCKAVSIDGLVQQIAVSYLRHGYYWYVTGAVREGLDPEHVDETIISKYDIRKCWRHRAHQKARGLANLQYIRHGAFYVILATKGRHAFKVMEQENVRDIREAPLHVPITMAPHLGRRKKNRKKPQVPVFEGYSISFRRGRYQRKTQEERAAYAEALAHWKHQAALGKRLPQPAKGTPDPRSHPHVAMETSSFRRLEAYLLSRATHWPQFRLEEEFRSVPYQPYWAVKQQLLMILGRVNRARKKAGQEQLPYQVVLGMKRRQIFPFGKPGEEQADRDRDSVESRLEVESPLA